MKNVAGSTQTGHVETLILLALIFCIPFLLALSALGRTELNRYNDAYRKITYLTSSDSIIKIGNPGQKQFPNSNAYDYFARSVWDMHCYDGSIYVGAGDFWNNRGPIDVWSFNADGKFEKEYTVDEEQVHLFREYDDKLFIPGMDPMGSSTYGNLYIKSSDEWQKLGTIPHALHVWDVAIFEGNIYVTVAGNGYSEVLRSSDMGQSWESVLRGNKAAFREIIALDDSLLVMGALPDGQPCIYRYINGIMEILAISPFPDMKRGAIHSRIVRFRDGVIYIGDYTPLALNASSSLIFLDDLDSGIVVIEEFQQKNVRDIAVRDDVCYVLTASESSDALWGCIYSSSDLKKWAELAEFSVPAMPYSFEILGGTFYVALGYSVENKYPESGSIYRLELDESSSTGNMELPAWDIDKDGTISMSDLALVAQHLGENPTIPLEPNPDVNGDGKVDILDIVLVGKHFGETYSSAIGPGEI